MKNNLLTYKNSILLLTIVSTLSAAASCVSIVSNFNNNVTLANIQKENRMRITERVNDELENNMVQLSNVLAYKKNPAVTLLTKKHFEEFYANLSIMKTRDFRILKCFEVYLDAINFYIEACAAGKNDNYTANELNKAAFIKCGITYSLFRFAKINDYSFDFNLKDFEKWIDKNSSISFTSNFGNKYNFLIYANNLFLMRLEEKEKREYKNNENTNPDFYKILECDYKRMLLLTRYN